MRLFLLRHAETEWNAQGRCQGVTDLDLSAAGRRQARRIADRLREETVDAVYSSDLKRARNTAVEVARPLRLTVRTDADLRELDHGAFEGLTFVEIRTGFPDFMERWQSRPAGVILPRGEGLTDVARRAWSSLERIARSHLPTETVLVVTHHFPIAAVLCKISGTPLDEYRSFKIETGGLSEIRHDGRDEWRIVKTNDTRHMTDPATAPNR
jgi:broad specificity phosphatase PhoE